MNLSEAGRSPTHLPRAQVGETPPFPTGSLPTVKCRCLRWLAQHVKGAAPFRPCCGGVRAGSGEVELPQWRLFLFLGLLLWCPSRHHYSFGSPEARVGRTPPAGRSDSRAGLYEMQRRRPLLFYQYVGRYKGTFECDRQGGMVDRLVEDLEARAAAGGFRGRTLLRVTLTLAFFF